jgi:pyruvate/2-oxoglutarate/acetoin dehydrogenase E1 component
MEMKNEQKVSELLNQALNEILSNDHNCLILGEDILDPYGGAFKVTNNLSVKFPSRVIQTPISEQGFIGLATGLAMKGFKPIVEIMFGDFMTLIVDNLINSTTKFHFLGSNRYEINLMVRTAIGGGRAYGPVHSQSLEKLFFGWPGIEVYSTSLINSPDKILKNCYNSKAPVKILLEQKAEYSKKIINQENLSAAFLKIKKNDDSFIMIDNVCNIPNYYLFISYGSTIERIIEVTKRIFEEAEIFSKILFFSKIYPIDITEHIEVLNSATKIIIIEDGYSDAGWGSYVVSEMIRNSEINLRLNSIKILGPKMLPIPANPDKEKNHFQTVESILNEIL